MMYDVVNLKNNLDELEDKQAYVKWWANRSELDLLLDKLNVNFEDIKDALEVKDNLYCIYIGQSKNRAISEYLRMQFFDKSSFTVSISSLLTSNPLDKKVVNDFIDKLKVEIFFVDFPVKSKEARIELDSSVSECIEKNLYILNSQKNYHPLAQNIKKTLSKFKKDAWVKFNDERQKNEYSTDKDNQKTSGIKTVGNDMWFVAAGENSSKIDLFKQNKIVAIGWQLDDISGKTKDEIDEKYAEVYPNDDAKKKGQAVSKINSFLNDINIGDYIITSDNVKRQYLIGKCISDYYFSKNIDEDVENQYIHFRDVEWLCSVSWDEISDESRNYIVSKTIFIINDIAKKEFLDIIKIIPSFSSLLKRNLIYFGAPGTGKSFKLNEDVSKLLEECEDNYERVTFHPDYAYANFVGTYKPVPKGEDISYEYVPGPFMKILIKALQKPFEPFILIIEEINRANVAATFGDVFQLLDREEGISQYPINASEDMKNYIETEFENMQISDKNRCSLKNYWKSLLGNHFDKIKIPSNLFIWATMNSADQGVFPMDTAFKRRWDFKYFSINHDEDLITNTHTILNNKTINWNSLRKQINDELLSYKVNEDKLMGPFFAFNEFMNQQIPEDIFKDIFKNKIIMYLFEDAAKPRRNDLFSGAKTKDYVTYSQICEMFDEKGLEIFCDNIKNRFQDEDEED